MTCRLLFERCALTVLEPATDAATGTRLNDLQKAEVVRYLTSPGSGPDGHTSYEDFVRSKMQSFPPELPPGVDYVAFSGKDRLDKPNYASATEYGKSLQGKAGIIGDTPWGKYIEDVVNKPEAHADFSQGAQQRVMERQMEQQTEERTQQQERGRSAAMG